MINSKYTNSLLFHRKLKPEYYCCGYELLSSYDYKITDIYVRKTFDSTQFSVLHLTGHEIAPNTVATATKIIVLATKIQKLVAKLATRTLWVLYILP